MHYYFEVDLPSLVISTHQKLLRVQNYELYYDNKSALHALFKTLYILESTGWYHGFGSIDQLTPMFF